MTILFRYLLREYLKIFGMCFVGLMTVYLVVDFFEKARRFMRYDAEFDTVLMYFAMRSPSIAFQIIPLAVLMATLLTIGLFARNHEITAMRSCGISLIRIAAPFLAFGLTVSFLLFGLSAVVIPYASAYAEYIKTVVIEKRPGLAIVKGDRQWLQTGNQTLMSMSLVDPDGLTLRDVTLYRLGANFQLQEITQAQQARYTGTTWQLEHGVERTLSPDGSVSLTHFQSKPLPLSQTPKDFSARVSTESEEMTLAELRSYADRLRRDGYNFSRHLTDFHGRLAFPFVSLVMVIVGIALSLLGAGSRSGGGLAMGIGQALAIGFLYWTAHSVAIALGRSGRLAPMVGPDLAAMMTGWLANGIFLSFGSYLFLKVRQ